MGRTARQLRRVRDPWGYDHSDLAIRRIEREGVEALALRAAIARAQRELREARQGKARERWEGVERG